MEIPYSDLIPLIVAVFLGGVVGLERQLKGHGAGLRTHMMVALASAIFILASRNVTAESTVEITRVVQGIAAGVGFIGAGTILKLSSEHEVLGLTTASTIWLSAAVGTASGMGEYFLAATAAAMAILLLVTLRPIEERYGRKVKSNLGETGKDL
jgi:putative Mg2+ transporter-C (MgtC) family protein